MSKDILKKIGVAAAAIVFFLLLSYAFVPQVLDGKIVNQSDISGYMGMAHEADEWDRAHPDDPTAWTDSMFGGMPTTAISLRNGGDWTQPLYNSLLLGKRPATYIFVALLGAFLLLLSFGIHPLLALAGAVAMAFCSYNFQIIQVGHNTKMQAIAFFPWVLAALVWTYRGLKEKKWLTRSLFGAALFALALSLEIKANHQQITYYLAIVVLVYALVELIHAIRSGLFGRFAAASVLLLALGVGGIATTANKLLPIQAYTPHTMRGGSALASDRDGGGLDLEYATAWSYGWEELPNLMIPNFNGGASAQAIDPDKSATVKLLRKAGQSGTREIAKALPLYWGPQPFTAGPMYMGAVTVFLFILGLLLWRGREKWWLLAVSVIAVLMAVGNHFMPFTRLCFKVLPLYNKFRTVSMALIVLQYSMPVLGFIVLDKILKGGYSFKQLLRPAIWAFALTGGFSLLLWIFPSLAGTFEGPSDAGQQDVLVEAFIADRIALLRADALRAFLLISATFGLILWAASSKSGKKSLIAGAAIGVLVLVNMFATGKRYLNESHFVTPKDFRKVFNERPVDKIILQDTDPSYRVLDLTVNVFNSSVPSYRHKNIGGYSPAKLSRYQDLIDRHLNREIKSIYNALSSVETVSEAEDALPRTPVLDALNLRYIILGASNPPLRSPGALGPAWFVSDVLCVDSPEQAVNAVGQVDLAATAVLEGPAPASLTPRGAEQGVDASAAPASLTPRGAERGDYAPPERQCRCRCTVVIWRGFRGIDTL